MAFLVNQRPCYQNLEQNLKPRSTLKKCIFKTKVSRVSLGADISFGIPFISLLSDWPRWLHLWPVFRAISKEKCKSNQHVCLSFISVIPELDPDSIGSNERYMLILFSLFFFFCLDSEEQLVSLEHIYVRRKKNQCLGWKPEGSGGSKLSIFSKKDEVKNLHLLIRWLETELVKMCCRQKFWKIPESVENSSKQGIFLLHLSY